MAHRIDTSGFGANCDDDAGCHRPGASGRQERQRGDLQRRRLFPGTTIGSHEPGSRRQTDSACGIRFVLVPGPTDDPENVRQVGEIVSRWKDVIDRVGVLPFHQLGKDKWHFAGPEYHLDTKAPTPEATEECPQLSVRWASRSTDAFVAGPREESASSLPTRPQAPQPRSAMTRLGLRCVGSERST